MKKRFIFPCIALISFSILIGCKGGGEKTEFTVTFNTQQGSEVPSQTIKKGEKVIKPDLVPTRGDDEAFSGWYTSPSEKEKYNFDNPVNNDFTLYAHYTSTLYYIDGSTDVDFLNENKHKFSVKDKDGKDVEGFTYGIYFPDYEKEETERIQIDPNTGILTQCLASKYVSGYIYAYKQLDGESYVHTVKKVEFASYDMLSFENGSVKFNKDYSFDSSKTSYYMVLPEYYLDSNNNFIKVNEVASNGFDKNVLKPPHSCTIHMADTIETINDSAFERENTTISINNIPKSIKKIGKKAFYGSSFSPYTDRLRLADTKLETIDDDAFFNVSLGYCDIVLPTTLKRIGARAFGKDTAYSIEFIDPYYFSYLKGNNNKQAAVLTDKKQNSKMFTETGDCYNYGIIKNEITSSGINYYRR